MLGVIDMETVPSYLTHFYRLGQQPFQNICDLDIDEAEKLLKEDGDWRGDGTYLSSRIKHEKLLHSLFIEMGGKPKRKTPIYMIVGDSPTGPHDLNEEYQHKIQIPIEIFDPDTISFTYPDSMYKINLDELEKVYLDRNNSPNIYRINELEEIIEKYEVYKHNNHYIEAQIWDDEPIKGYMEMRRCK